MGIAICSYVYAECVDKEFVELVFFFSSSPEKQWKKKHLVKASMLDELKIPSEITFSSFSAVMLAASLYRGRNILNLNDVESSRTNSEFRECLRAICPIKLTLFSFVFFSSSGLILPFHFSYTSFVRRPDSILSLCWDFSSQITKMNWPFNYIIELCSHVTYSIIF